MKILEIPVKNTEIYDMLKTRGYVSIRNKGFYHKFHGEMAFLRWFKTGKIELAWGETVLELIRHTNLKYGRIEK